MKYSQSHVSRSAVLVSTLVVEWIEILTMPPIRMPAVVSTLVVEWIEIRTQKPLSGPLTVSTLVVEWIEIFHLANLHNL